MGLPTPKREKLQRKFEEASSAISCLSEAMEHYEAIARDLFPRKLRDMSATEKMKTAGLILRLLDELDGSQHQERDEDEIPM